MLKRLKKLLGKQKQRTGLIIGAIVLFIAAIVIFISFELQHNQSLYISNYRKEQQKLTNQVALRLETYLGTDQLPITAAVDKLISEVETTGSSYWFIAKDEQLLFVKNKNTSELFTYISLSSFLQDSKSDGIKLASSSFMIDGVQYTIGTCTTSEYISESGELFKHSIYIIMPLILLASVLLVIFIFGILTINRQETRINRLTAEAVERNITIEQLTQRMKKSSLNDFGGTRSKITAREDIIIYSKEVLASLLEKINRDNIVPLTIFIIELTSKNQSYNRDDYNRFMKMAPGYLKKEHVLAEIMPGVFTLLLFHTMSEEQEQIKKTLIHEWALPLKKKKVKVRMGISFIKDYDADVENVFELVYREVAGMQESSRLKLSS